MSPRSESARQPGVLVGLEIHQQLSSQTKLFCACPPKKSEELPYSVERRLRPAQSEMGGVDPAALFEFAKGKSNVYLWSPESSCLVETDEEPPHPPSQEALESAMVVSSMLDSRLVDEIHVMRKIVIDGSNTSGFQRTMVVGLGGSMEVGGTKVGVQSVTLEEDAARVLGEDAQSKRFVLDRLGVPLVEVALEPVLGDPKLVERVALHLGRALRSTGRVARGLGTIRQDLNISVMGGKVVEVKGVQKLNLVAKVVEYETRRQLALVEVAKKLKGRSPSVECAASDVTGILSETKSRALRAQLSKGGAVICIRARGTRGLLGWEPLEGARLGKELAEVARASGLGGVTHSDEFEQQGVSEAEEASLREATGAGPDDGLVLVAGPRETAERAARAVEDRLRESALGVPAETRGATEEGETRYLRPRPGSQRMYPETDIPEVAVGADERRRAAALVPAPWEKEVERYTGEFSLSAEMALKLYDSDSVGSFERLARELQVEPSYIATVLVDLPARLAREGVPERSYSLPILEDLLRAIGAGRVAKEAAFEVLAEIGSGRAPGVEEAASKLGLQPMGEREVKEVVDSVVSARARLIAERGEASFSVLMGEVMLKLRGRADGEAVSKVLRSSIDRARRGKDRNAARRSLGTPNRNASSLTG